MSVGSTHSLLSGEIVIIIISNCPVTHIILCCVNAGPKCQHDFKGSTSIIMIYVHVHAVENTVTV